MSVASGSSRPPVKASRRRWIVAAPLAAVAALGLGAAGVARLPAEPASATAGEALRIEVVQPPAPKVAPGPRMEVGELVDGYRHVAYRASDVGDLLGELYAEAWLEPLPDLPPPPRWRDEEPPEPRAVAEVRPTAPQPASFEVESGNPYGFDRPAPDYAAERRARRERIERIEMERMARREERAPWNRVGDYARPPRLEVETAFY